MNLYRTLSKILSFSAVAAIVAPTIALAQTTPVATYNAPHKWVDSAAGKTYVYIPGKTPGVPVAGFVAPKTPTIKVLTLNPCGWGSFTKSTTSPPTLITGTGFTVNWASKTNGTDPTCVAPVAPATTYTSSNAGAVGTVVDTGSKVWIKGGTTAGGATINVTTSGAIVSKVNACGFVRVATSPTRPLTSFSIGTTNFTLAALPSVNAPLKCQKVGTNQITYIPKP